MKSIKYVILEDLKKKIWWMQIIPVISVLMLSTDISFSFARKLELLPLKRSLSTPSLCTAPSSAVAGKHWAYMECTSFNSNKQTVLHRYHCLKKKKKIKKYLKMRINLVFLVYMPDEIFLEQNLLQIQHSTRQPVRTDTQCHTFASASLCPNWANVIRPVDSSDRGDRKRGARKSIALILIRRILFSESTNIQYVHVVLSKANFTLMSIPACEHCYKALKKLNKSFNLFQILWAAHGLSPIVWEEAPLWNRCFWMHFHPD